MPTLVRQLDPGVTALREILDASAPLPIADSVAIVAQVACQLASTHEDGGIHGDVRPAAILIRREPSNPQAIGEVQLAAPRSQAGNRTNAPEYRSPEQIRGEKIDPRTDVFALGLVFYEMLTGRLLRSGAEPSLPSELNPDVPPELDGLVLAMLDKNPRRRLPTAGIAVRDLLRINSQLGDRDALRAKKPISVRGASSDPTKHPGAVPSLGPQPRSPSAPPSDRGMRARIPRPFEPQPRSASALSFAPTSRRPKGVSTSRVPSPRPAQPVREAAPWRISMWIAIGVALLLMGVSGWQYLHEFQTMRVEAVAGSPASPDNESTGTQDAQAPALETAPAALPPIPAQAPTPENTVSPPPSTKSLSDSRAAAPALTSAPADVQAPAQTSRAGAAPPRNPTRAGSRDSVEKTAKVFFTVAPWGEIYVDGIARGRSPPLTVVELSPGAHRIDIRHARAPAFLTFVNVKAGETRRIRHEFGI